MAFGVGVGLRAQFSAETDRIFQHVDFLEYNMRPSLALVEEDLAPFIGRMPVVIHSLNLSLGSVQPPPEHRVQLLKAVSDFVKPSWVSEHLSFSRYEDIEIESFIPLPYTEEAVETAAANIAALQRLLGRPMAMENITHSFVWPGGEMSEAEFVKRVMEQADCGLLLDVTNLYLNSKTLGYDPYEYLKILPKERIMQLHLAGHTERNGQLMDTHVGGIDQEVLTLTEWVLRHTPCQALVIERDTDLQGFDDLLEDIHFCRDLFNKYRSRTTEGAM